MSEKSSIKKVTGSGWLNRHFLFAGAMVLVLAGIVWADYRFSAGTASFIVQQKVSGLVAEAEQMAAEQGELNEAAFALAASRLQPDLVLFLDGGITAYGSEQQVLVKPFAGERRKALLDIIKAWDALSEMMALPEAERPVAVQRATMTNFFKEQTMALQVLLRDYYYNRIQWQAYVRYGGALAIIILLAVWLVVLVRTVVRPVAELSNVAVRLSEGDTGVSVQKGARGIFGALGRAINQMGATLGHATDFTQRIGSGELDASYQGEEGEENGLAASLLRMQEEMQSAAAADRERNWVTEGLASFSDILTETPG